MVKILQCLVCFTVIMAAARTERSHFFYTRNVGGVNATELTSETNTTDQLSEGLLIRGHEAGRQRRESGDLQDDDENLITLSEECEKKGYCEDVPNYPTELAETLLREMGDTIDFQMDLLNDELENFRRFSANKDKELCNYNVQIIYPDGIKMDGKWQRVLRAENEKLQGFRTETCINEGTPCQNDNVSIESGYKGTCRQQVSNRTIIIIKNKRLEQVQKELPSACLCGVTLE